MTSIVEMVKHYQRSIDKSMDNQSRLMHCIEKLHKLPITVEHLQETGIGRTVNGLRKYDGEVGYAAKTLVTKWKQMVAAEEAEKGIDGQEQTINQSNEENDEDDEQINCLKIDETENIDPDPEPEREIKVESTFETVKKEESVSHKKKNKHRRHETEMSSHSQGCSKSKSPNDTVNESKKKENSSRLHHHHHHHSSKHKSSKSSSNHKHREKKYDEEKESRKHEKRHTDNQHEKESSRYRKEDDKSVKKHKPNSGDEIMIDSSMGASFADALGMLDMPSTSKKKSRPSSSSLSCGTIDNNTDLISQKDRMYRILDESGSGSSNKNSKSIPALLTKRLKLEPLPDISAEIAPSVPVISNNYKPLPLNPTVMDCVFNQPKVRQMTDEEAFGYSIMSKKERTKVFSGQKIGFRGEVPSLYDLCIRLLQEHIDDLETTGGIPYDILKPILERATVHQLLTIEDYNSYLIEDTDELWSNHCKRRFRGRQPEELESWRELYLRMQDEEEQRFQKLTKNIKAAQQLSIPVKKTKLAYVDNYIKPPRNVIKTQERYGTNSLVTASPATRVATLDGHLGVKLAKPGDVKLRVANAIRDAVPSRATKRSRSYEADPEWLPNDWYMRNNCLRQPRSIKKSIDMIRYDRAKLKKDQKRRKRIKNLIDKDHPYSAPSSVPASPAQILKDHCYA